MGVEFRESRFLVCDRRCRAVTKVEEFFPTMSSFVFRGLFVAGGGIGWVDDSDGTGPPGGMDDKELSGTSESVVDSGPVARSPPDAALVVVDPIVMDGGKFNTSPALIPFPMALLGL